MKAFLKICFLVLSPFGLLWLIDTVTDITVRYSFPEWGLAFMVIGTLIGAGQGQGSSSLD